MKNTHKGFILPLLVALIALLAIGGGIYYSQKSKAPGQEKKQENTQTTTTTTNTPASTQYTATNGQTAGWNTYTNSQLGFSLAYPSQWGNPKELIPDGDVRSFVIGDSLVIDIGVHVNKTTGKPMTLNELRGIPTKESELKSPTQSITISGKYGTEKYSTQTGTVIDVDLGNNKIFTISYGAKPDDPVLKQIISSIKFTTLASQTSDWKIYTNNDYGFQLQYTNDATVNLVSHVSPHGADLVLPSSNQKGGNLIEKDGSVGDILTFFIFQEPVSNLEQYITNDVRSSQDMNNKYLDQNGNPPVKITYTKTNMNNVVAYKVRYDYPQNPSQKSLNRIYIQNLKHVFIFDYHDNEASKAEQILSTFKFTK